MTVSEKNDIDIVYETCITHRIRRTGFFYYSLSYSQMSNVGYFFTL